MTSFRSQDGACGDVVAVIMQKWYNLGMVGIDRYIFVVALLLAVSTMLVVIGQELLSKRKFGGKSTCVMDGADKSTAWM